MDNDVERRIKPCHPKDNGGSWKSNVAITPLTLKLEEEHGLKTLSTQSTARKNGWPRFECRMMMDPQNYEIATERIEKTYSKTTDEEILL